MRFTFLFKARMGKTLTILPFLGDFVIIISSFWPRIYEF